MPYSKYSPKQKKLARVAKPRNKITGADFKKLKAKKEKEMKKKLKAPKGYHFMKSGKTYKLMKHEGKFKPHKGASLTAEFEVQKTHG